MTIPRRTFLLAGAAAAMTLPLAACSSPGTTSTGSGGKLTLWIWSGAVGDTVAKSAATQFKKQSLQVSTIGGDFKQKLVTSFTAKSGLPSVTGVKGEDMPYFLQQADLFADLKKVAGASALLASFPKSKLADATSADGRLIGIPIDIGPTGLFFREDILSKAKLASTPDDVAAATSTWSDYFAFGQKLKAATGAFLQVNISDVFQIAMAQSATKFVDAKGNFLGESAAVKNAWELAIQAKKLGISAGLQDGSPDWAAAITKGTLPTVIGAAWHAGDISGSAPKTSGKWRVTTTPGGAANIGGSFFTIPATTTDTAEAFKLISYLTNAKNEATSYTETGNFPAFTPALSESALTGGAPFFGGQVTSEVFKKSAESMPTVYVSPYDSQVSAPYYTQLTDVENNGKDPDAAWKAAVTAAKAALAAAQ